jgi:small subunit ribosomal protein S20
VANHPSAEKRNRQRIVRTERNRNRKSAVRTAVKQVRAAAAAGEMAAVKTTLKNAIVVIAKAGTKGVLHKKTVSRRIGRLAKMAHKLATAKPAAVEAAPAKKAAKAPAKKAAAKKTAKA